MESSKLASIDHNERRVDLFYSFGQINIKLSSWDRTKEVLIFKQRDGEWVHLHAAESLFIAMAYLMKTYKI